MNIHKHARLTLLDRKETWQPYQTRRWKAAQLAERFRVSRPMAYAVLKRARLQKFVAPRQRQPAPQDSPVRPKTARQGRTGHPGPVRNARPGATISPIPANSSVSTPSACRCPKDNRRPNPGNTCLWPLAASPGGALRRHLAGQGPRQCRPVLGQQCPGAMPLPG